MDFDDTESHSPTVTTNNKRNSSEDASTNPVGGGIPVSSTLGKQAKCRKFNKSYFNWPVIAKKFSRGQRI